MRISATELSKRPDGNTKPIVVEPMGNEILLHFFIGGKPVCARASPNCEVRHGERFDYSFDIRE